MFVRFKPYTIFEENEKRKVDVSSVLSNFCSSTRKGNANHWIVFDKHFNDIISIGQWTADNFEFIKDVFPRSKSSEIYKNRHVLVKQFAYLQTHTPPWLGSRGFEGSNLRLVISSTKERELICRLGEFQNFTGFVLDYRDDFPMHERCELCSSTNTLKLCRICGRWSCKDCSVDCNKCEKWICEECDTEKDPFTSEHQWHFHKNK
jgi:hypothetical protein